MPARLGRAELAARIAVQPAPRVGERGEGTRRRRPPGDRRPGLPGPVLRPEPAPQHLDVKVGGLGAAVLGGVPEQPADVAQVGPDGVRRQPALGGQVPLERGQRPVQSRRQPVLALVTRDGDRVRVATGPARGGGPHRD